MGNLKEIKTRIASVQSISQITKAMKMVASSKIGKAEALLKARTPYTKQLVSIMSCLFNQLDEITHPLMTDFHQHQKIGILVITSEKGLCGAYNGNVLKDASKFMNRLDKEGYETVAYLLGAKAVKYFDRRDIPCRWSSAEWDAEDEFADKLFLMLVDDYMKEIFDVLYIIHATANSKSSYKVERKKYLPFAPEVKPSGNENFIFEPSVELAVDLIVPMTLKQILVTAMLESRYAEYGARIVAMTNATENAEKLVDELRMSFFRARQEAITTEILEVSLAAVQLEKS